MAFEWSHYIDLAEELNSATATDAKMRTAISRAYYGVFCICRRKKDMHLVYYEHIHKEVVKRYKESENSCEYTIGNILDGLRKKRIEADYTAIYPITWQQTKIDINQARSIINLFERIEAGECD